MLGFIVQRLLLGDVDADGFRDGVRVLLRSPSLAETPGQPGKREETVEL